MKKTIKNESGIRRAVWALNTFTVSSASHESGEAEASMPITK